MIHVPDVPWLLHGEPRPVQLEALLRSYYGIALRDEREAPPRARELPHAGQGPARGWGHYLEMRLGKTPLMCNEFLLYRRDHGYKKMFLFAPNKYKYTWGLEFEKFGMDLPFHVFESEDRAAFHKWMQKNQHGAVFVNYEALQHQANLPLFEQFVDWKTYMGADESVFLKGRGSLTSRRGIDLARMAGATRAASGKPTPQGISDMFNQMKFCKQLEGMNYFQFRGKFAKMGGFKNKKEIGIRNIEDWEALRFKSGFFAQRADWGTKIVSDYETVKLRMEPSQANAYRQMDDEFMTWVTNDQAVTADQIITKHQKMQQISSGFIIDEFKDVHWLVPFDKTPKFVDLIDRIENYVSGKCLVFFHYTATGDALIAELTKRKIGHAVIRGGQYMDKHRLSTDAEKARFNDDPECNVLVGQMKAIKYGHTLMGTREDPCLTSIYFENTYSLDDRAQTEERNQGEGQLDAINIVDYWTSPVEREIVYALQRKEEIAQKIMGYYKEA